MPFLDFCTMNVLFYASGELKLSDECIFGLASWQHHTSVTLQCACVPVCLCASPCSLFSLFGQNIPPPRYPLFLIFPDAKLWTNITSCNLQHEPHLVSLIKSNMVSCQIIKAFQSLTPQQNNPPHRYPLLPFCQDVRMQNCEQQLLKNTATKTTWSALSKLDTGDMVNREIVKTPRHNSHSFVGNRKNL